MPIQADAVLEITAFAWVPAFAQGFVRDLRPRWACEELGLPYRERLISAVDRPKSYFAEQPWGQVPFLQDGEIALFESGAILIHLGEKSALLPAAGQARASVLSWTLAAFNSLEPLLFELGQVDVFARREEWAKLRRPSLVASLGQRLARLEAALGAREWFAGDFSIADIAMTTVLREAAHRGMLQDRPGLEAYVARGTARAGFEAALAAQLAAFAAHEPDTAIA